MARIHLRAPGREGVIEVELERTGDASREVYAMQWDGQRAEVEFARLDGMMGWMHVRGRVVPFAAARRKDRVQVWAAGRTYEIEVVDRTVKRSREGASRGAARPELAAPMPGTILQIHVKAGDSFAAQQPLVVMESMKMEMSLTAAAAGRVKEVLCRPGQLVEMGAILARFEASGDGAMS